MDHILTVRDARIGDTIYANGDDESIRCDITPWKEAKTAILQDVAVHGIRCEQDVLAHLQSIRRIVDKVHKAAHETLGRSNRAYMRYTLV